MSTRASIFWLEPNGDTHLFEDVAVGYRNDGLHLDIRRWGEAIANFVLKRREREALDAALKEQS